MKSTSLKQIGANRRNAARSSGPRTLEGKAVSRFNALKSGVNASAEFIPGEDSLEYDDVRIAYDERWNPQTPEQRSLVDRLIRCDWLQRRLGKAEAHLWRYRQGHYHPDDAGQALSALGAAQANGGTDFERLQRRINQTQRAYDKTLETLQDMSIAAAEVGQELSPATTVGQALSPATEPPEPAPPSPPAPEQAAAGVGQAVPPATEPPETPNRINRMHPKMGSFCQIRSAPSRRAKRAQPLAPGPWPPAPNPASDASLLLY